MARRPPPPPPLVLFLSSCCLIIFSLLFVACDASVPINYNNARGRHIVAMTASVYRTRDGRVITSKVIQTVSEDSPNFSRPPLPISQLYVTTTTTATPVTSTPPPPAPANGGARAKRGQLAKEFLASHNRVRQQLHMPPLAWDRKLARFARGWAATLAGGDCSKPRHSEGPYGENAFWGSGADWKPADAVSSWANEYAFYNTSNNSCKPGNDCGHYTQIIWRTSTRVGCDRVTCPSGDTYITCNYDPPGNYVGESPFDLPH